MHLLFITSSKMIDYLKLLKVFRVMKVELIVVLWLNH